MTVCVIQAPLSYAMPHLSLQREVSFKSQHTLLDHLSLFMVHSFGLLFCLCTFWAVKPEAYWFFLGKSVPPIRSKLQRRQKKELLMCWGFVALWWSRVLPLHPVPGWFHCWGTVPGGRATAGGQLTNSDPDSSHWWTQHLSPSPTKSEELDSLMCTCEQYYKEGALFDLLEVSHKCHLDNRTQRVFPWRNWGSWGFQEEFSKVLRKDWNETLRNARRQHSKSYTSCLKAVRYKPIHKAGFHIQTVYCKILQGCIVQ